MGVNIKWSGKRVENLTETEKKWLSVLTREKKLLKVLVGTEGV